MPKLIIIRSPQADFRPEKFIINKLVSYMVTTDLEVVEIHPQQEFTTLDSQSLFYSNDTMTQSFFHGVSEAIKVIEDGDVVFFADALCPVIPALKFHLHCAGFHKVKMCGIFHSSVETPGDFLYEAGQWVRDLENCLMNCLSVVFVATSYGKNILKKNKAYNNDSCEIMVTGLPRIVPEDTGCVRPQFLYSGMPNVMFSHRWTYDKRPEYFVNLAAARNQVANFIVIHPVPLPKDDLYGRAIAAGIKFVHAETKQQYWDALSFCDIVFSSAILETFGYSILEATEMGALPMVPNEACYPYMYNIEYMWDATSNDVEDNMLTTFDRIMGYVQSPTYMYPPFLQRWVNPAMDTFEVNVTNKIKSMLQA